LQLSYQLGNMPKELIYQISQMLPLRNVLLMCGTCHYLHSVLEDPMLWHFFFKRWSAPKYHYFTSYLNLSLQDKKGLCLASEKSENRWKKGLCHGPELMVLAHTITSVRYYFDPSINCMVCAQGAGWKMWDVKNKKILGSWKNSSETFHSTCLKIKENRLVLGAWAPSNGVIIFSWPPSFLVTKDYKRKTKQTITPIQKLSSDTVRCLDFTGDTLVSSTLATTQVWDMNTGQVVKTISFSKGDKTLILSDPHTLYTQDNAYITAHDLRSGRMTFKALEGYCMDMDGYFLAAASSTNILLFDCRKFGDPVMKFDPGQRCSCLKLSDWKLVGDVGNSVQLFDISSANTKPLWSKHHLLTYSLDYNHYMELSPFYLICQAQNNVYMFDFTQQTGQRKRVI